MNEDRVEIIRRLGNKCIKCDERNLSVLHIDHRLGHGYIENQIFENKDEMYSYYLKYFNEESPFLQILCMNCNTKKRMEKNETAGRPTLEQLLHYVNEQLLKGNLEEAKKRMEEFPQIIPLMLRLSRNGKNFLERYSSYEWKEIESHQITTKFKNNILNNNKLDSSEELPLLIDEIFMKTVSELEGSNRKPIPFTLLLKHLMKNCRCSEKTSRDLIHDMMYKNVVIASNEGNLNTPTEDDLKRIREKRQQQQTEVSKMQLFFHIIKSLEGDEKRPVEEKAFVNELVKTGKFTEEEARKYMKRLQRESAIYESKPGHYNSI